MGSLGGGNGSRRPRFLCLHGFRTSGEIMRKQVLGRWPAEVTARLDLIFADAPFPAEGKSDVEGIFDPPYLEWFQFDEGFTKYRNLEKCLAYIEDLMIKHGPFDGLMGFSQGSILCGGLPGLQQQGLALTRVALNSAYPRWPTRHTPTRSTTPRFTSSVIMTSLKPVVKSS